jgi:hypothetical protein
MMTKNLGKGCLILLLALLPACRSKPRLAAPPPPLDPKMEAKARGELIVSFQGPVRNPVVPWTEGLKLSQALDAAQYLERNTPIAIFLIRNGTRTYISPRRLLSGTQDPVLQPDDVIEIQR